MWKDWIRPFVRPLPQWSVVAVAPPQQAVSASLRWDGNAADVTADHTVASLKPLMIATSVEAGPRPLLEYVDSATGRLLGVLHLEQTASIAAGTASLALYRVAAGEHRCLGWPRRPWNAWLQNRLMRKNRSSPHSALEPAAVQQLMEKVKEGGMIGWSVIASRTVTFPDGTKKEEKRKVTYKPKPRRVEVHPCRIPKGEPGATGEKCPEIEPEPSDAPAEAAASPP